MKSNRRGLSNRYKSGVVAGFDSRLEKKRHPKSLEDDNGVSDNHQESNRPLKSRSKPSIVLGDEILQNFNKMKK